MSRYSKEKREHAVSLMAPPNNLSVAETSGRTGIPEATLYLWRNRARVAGRVVPGDGSNPEDWRAEDKFRVVVETLGLAEAELAEYSRRKGLFVGQIARWREVCENANTSSAQRSNPGALAAEKKRVRELEKELSRKEKALAETATLLVLSRKLEALQSRNEGV